MKSQILLSLGLVLAVTTMAPEIQAQNAGFQAAGIRPIVNSPVQPFVTAPVQPVGRAHIPVVGFGVAPPIVPPILTTTYPQNYFPPVQGISPFGFQQQFPVFVAPNGQRGPFQPIPAYGGFGPTLYPPYAPEIYVPYTVITNSTVIIQQPAAGQVIRVGPGHAVRPATGPLPQIGASREQLIQQFGTPTTSAYSQGGETLFFTGGLTVTIENGKVATAQRST